MSGAGTELPAAWRLPVALAWEAFGAGSRPIGAALLDADGAVVACGRNRSQEAAAPPGQLAGAAIAHAETNVLAQLRSRRRYGDHRLFTTLEPRLLCSGDDGPLGLARRCLDTPGFTEAETVEAAYRLALPRIAEAGS
ncbi:MULTISPECIES: hypothetical protein [unclassified Streptomyces]|uniref:hypothetical protein n=1 Tax=unclassified Streptomyces TaxID=2593676 RepID=UPI001CBCC819|nr:MULTISPECIES: hypothetical protein [unclassified Streptomyces]WPO76351.1 hypothetical protein R9806_37345 [Streptomyces sp. KN37]